MATSPEFTLSCPFPIRDYPRVLLAHGGGGRLMHQLISRVFLTTFHNPLLAQQHDASVFQVDAGKMALTTDSYVVRPLFFPGGDIGSMAVHGTVNDLAMAGARPLYLTAGFIIEEGFPMEDLWKIAASMRKAADEAGVQIITGDTKVVDRGKGDGVFINTTGVGVVECVGECSPRMVRPGDAILVSGDVGRHGMAIMAVREGLAFESAIESDSAPVSDVVLKLIGAGIHVHCLRDITRGGLTSGLNEIAVTSGFGIEIDERCVPVRADVQAACEFLGLDAFNVACEGRFIAFLPETEVDEAIRILHSRPVSATACRIGKVTSENQGRVVLRSSIGVSRILDVPSGEQLPRIC